jgi:hypothetical protein
MKITLRIALLSLGLIVLYCGASTPFAQTPPPRVSAPQPAKPPAPPPPAPPPSEPKEPTVNVRLDVTITDRAGETVAPPKTITMLLADVGLSQMRSTFDDRTVNIDARSTIVNGRIKVILVLSSDPRSNDPRSPFGDTRVVARHSATLLLDNGKPLVVFESTDQAANRKTTIELKATIQR